MKNYKDLVEKVLADERYQANITYGSPRDGHPEGSILAHIAELLKNLGKIQDMVSDEVFQKLLFLVHVHDTFKGESEKDVPIEHPNSHSSLAKKYAEQYTNELSILEILQLHDVNYLLWKQFRKSGVYNETYLQLVLDRVVDLPLYILFTLVDGAVEGKDGEKLLWFYLECRRFRSELVVDETILKVFGASTEISI